MKNKYILLAVLIVVTAAAIGLAVKYGKGKITYVGPVALNSPATVDQLKADLDQATQYELEHGCTQLDSRGQKTLCGESRVRVDQMTAKYQNALFESRKPTAEQMAAEEASIRQFMKNPNLGLVYVSSGPSPSNFNVGIMTPLENGNGGRLDTTDEWQRPIDTYQQIEYINDRCEVYEYEIDKRNAQIVEIHVRYPQDIENQHLTAGQTTDKCESYGSMETPLKTKDQIEQVALDYASRSGSPMVVNSAIQPVYTPSTKTPKTIAAMHELMWQDKSYKLPTGLYADLYPFPTLRVMITSGGKLLYYFNSTNLFN